jgi:hypothetical protein
MGEEKKREHVHQYRLTWIKKEGKLVTMDGYHFFLGMNSHGHLLM